MCGSIVDMQYLTADNSQEKKERRRKLPQLQNILACPWLYAVIIKS